MAFVLTLGRSPEAAGGLLEQCLTREGLSIIWGHDCVASRNSAKKGRRENGPVVGSGNAGVRTWAGSPGDRAGVGRDGQLRSLPAFPRVSSAGASSAMWSTPAPASRTVPSTAPAETDASTVACRNAWHWACPEMVRPSRQPPGVSLESPKRQAGLLC